MPRPSPSPRQQPGRVSMRVAEGGDTGDRSEGGAVSAGGRHRAPDTGELPAPGRAGGRGTAPASPNPPHRHGAVDRRARFVPRRPAPDVLARVEAAQVAASRPAPRPEPGAAVAAPMTVARRGVTPTGSARPVAPTSPPAAPASSAAAPSAARATAARPTEDDAVTDLVPAPARRGRAPVPDEPGSGRAPGVVGLALAVVALVAAVTAAAVPDLIVPGIGRLGASSPALSGLLAVGLAATACAALGTGRQRRGRGVALSGMVVGLAAVAAAVVPLAALASL